MAIDQNGNQIDDKLEQGLESDVTPKAEEPKEDQGDKIPYHQDPNIQLYIERQVAKRVGEGNQAWEDRIARLEQTLTKGREPETTKIGDWTPATSSDAQAAKAIIQQAKQEMLEEFQTQQQQAQEQRRAEDTAFSDWIGELKATSVLKDDADSQEFAKLIVKYKLDDRQAAVDLWNTLQERVQEAKDQGLQQGEKQGIKKAQEAKIGSARKGNEPGQTGRSYKERRAQEPNFDAILNREMTRLGY